MKYISIILIILALYSWKKKFDPAPNGDLDLFSRIDESMAPAHIKQHYKMVWNDEFNGTSLNTAKWMYRRDGTQRTIGWLNRDNVSLNGLGQLVISSTKGTDNKYYTGMVATEGLFEQKYGYFECRMKMHKGRAVHSAFWLHSPTIGAGNPLDYKKDGVEIDVVEYLRTYANDTDISKGYEINLHWDGYEANHKKTGKRIDFSALGDDAYHTFAVEWTEDEYIFYADGIETWRTSQAVSQRAQFIILSTEIVGWAGPAETGTYPDKTYFDYVRVYTKK